MNALFEVCHMAFFNGGEYSSYLDVEDINLAVVISCNCPFIEGIQSWQNQFPTGSDVIFTVSVSHSESILASLPGSFHLKSLEVV